MGPIDPPLLLHDTNHSHQTIPSFRPKIAEQKHPKTLEFKVDRQSFNDIQCHKIWLILGMNHLEAVCVGHQKSFTKIKLIPVSMSKPLSLV